MKAEYHACLFYDRIGFWIGACLWAAVSAFLVYGCPLWSYGWNAGESVQILESRGFFDSLTGDRFPVPPIPHSNLNPLAGMLFSLANHLPFQESVWVWAGLTFLGVFLIGGAVRFLPDTMPSWFRLSFVALFLLYPGMSLLLFTSPSSLLCLSLSLWMAGRILRGYDSDGWGWLLLFLMTLTGPPGLFWGMAIVLAQTAATFGVPSENSTPRWPWLSYLALIPVWVMLLYHSLVWGMVGGPRLVGIPTLFSELSMGKWLDGTWTLESIRLLKWFAGGMLALPFLIPVFGIVVLAGWLDAWNQGRAGKRLCILFACLAVLSWIFFPFLPDDQSRVAILPLWPLALLMAFQGVRWVSNTFPIQETVAHLLFLGILLASFFFSLPEEWGGILGKARYDALLCSHLNQILRDASSPTAVRFDPVVFSHLENPGRLYPIGLAIQCRFGTPQGDQSGLDFDLWNTPAPETILFYPRFGESVQNNLPVTESSSLWENALSPFYTAARQYSVIRYSRKSDSSVIVRNQWLSRQYGRGDLYAALRSAREDAPVSFESEAFIPDATFPQPVGLCWDFEHGFQNVHSDGFAFGFSPKTSARAVGLYGASSGNPDTAQRMGVLESVPFILEGDEFRLMADLPRDSTATLFCLAVYEEKPLGGDSPIQHTRHILERRTGESLAGTTFFYIRPQQLTYLPGRVRGWHVVRLLRETEQIGWQAVNWSVDPWRGKQAVWMAVDQSPFHFLQMDQILQWKRPVASLVFNFESGEYEGWRNTGNAFGVQPAHGARGAQRPILGFEGNYFISSYTVQNGDQATGELISPRFLIQASRMRFLIGGGNDLERLQVALRIGEETVLRATGRQSEQMESVEWDLSSWVGQSGEIRITDSSKSSWGHILVDDIRIENPPQFIPEP